MIGGIVMVFSNLMFVWIVKVGLNEYLFLVIFFVDNFIFVFLMVVFVFFLILMIG